ncbi:MAG: DUF4328 domain-containing protein [Planctomycetes bacterium]|nr:DUF4328 domain-containing protein [Planctomycetota bacterium]
MFNNGNDAATTAAILIGLGITLAISLAINLFVCWLVYRANEALPPEHRKTESWQAFLLLIPLFNLIWNFVLLARVSGGMQSYFGAKGDTSAGDCGASIGLWYSICCIACFVPIASCIAGPAALVLLILYLVKISGLRTRVLIG